MSRVHPALLADQRRWRLTIVALLSALALLQLKHAIAYDYVSDDGFIVLRYARNLVDGHGLVFNPGERVEGFTSPTWVAVIALAHALDVDPLVAARLSGQLFAWLTQVLACALASVVVTTPTGVSAWCLLPPLLIAASGSFACWTAAGLESSLFAAVVTAAMLAAATGRDRLSALLAALAFWTRPEGLLLFAPMLVERAVASRGTAARQVIEWGAIVAAASVPLLILRFWYYGELLPNTYYAKSEWSLAQLERGLRYLGDYAADHEGITLLMVIAIVAVIRRDCRTLLVVATVATFLLGIVAEGGDGLAMYRFMVPILPLLFVLETGLLAHLSVRIGARGSMLVLPLAAVLVFVHWSPPAVSPHYALYAQQRTTQIRNWSHVGLWLAEHGGSGESFAAVPIGAVSYYSGLVARDIVGLTDRHIARGARKKIGSGFAGHDKFDAGYVLSLRPTYLLLGNIDVTAGRPRDPRARPFIPLTPFYLSAIDEAFFRERDFELHYEPFSAEIAPGEFLNAYRLRSDIG